jgi:hypothetical protein
MADKTDYQIMCDIAESLKTTDLEAIARLSKDNCQSFYRIMTDNIDSIFRRIIGLRAGTVVKKAIVIEGKQMWVDSTNEAGELILYPDYKNVITYGKYPKSIERFTDLCRYTLRERKQVKAAGKL